MITCRHDPLPSRRRHFPPMTFDQHQFADRRSAFGTWERMSRHAPGMSASSSSSADGMHDSVPVSADGMHDSGSGEGAIADTCEAEAAAQTGVPQ